MKLTFGLKHRTSSIHTFLLSPLSHCVKTLNVIHDPHITFVTLLSKLLVLVIMPLLPLWHHIPLQTVVPTGGGTVSYSILGMFPPQHSLPMSRGGGLHTLSNQFKKHISGQSREAYKDTWLINNTHSGLCKSIKMHINYPE